MDNVRCCEMCGKELTKISQKKYCSDSCARKHQFKKKCDIVDKTGVFPVSGRLNETDRRFAKRYLERRYGHYCKICGLSEWNSKPIPLIADHIDGDSSNHRVDNIRLICPNCDAQQPTYKTRNSKTDTYVPGDRAERHYEEYTRRLERAGLKRCEPRVREKSVCLYCGEEFPKKHSTQKYCSRGCVCKHRQNR